MKMGFSAEVDSTLGSGSGNHEYAKQTEGWSGQAQTGVGFDFRSNIRRIEGREVIRQKAVESRLSLDLVQFQFPRIHEHEYTDHLRDGDLCIVFHAKSATAQIVVLNTLIAW